MLLAGVPAARAQLPAPVLPQGVGVNIHFVTGHERDLDLIAAAGCKFIRMDFSWTAIERQRGRYDWSGYEALLAQLDRRGLRALFILDYSNPLYETTGTNGVVAPQHPESVAAFAAWAAAAAAHFHGRGVLWEIWNEPNIFFWRPKPDAAQYTTLALATARAIRAADPAATILGPASSGFPWSFFETLFAAGAPDLLDAVTVHPYRDYQHGPETAAADYAKLRVMIARHTAGKAAPPILSGEWGYSTFDRGVSLETQADFAARQQLANLLAGVRLSIWYDWKNDGPDAAEREHNFGLVFADLRPKPAYLALKTLTTELAGCRIETRLEETARPDDYLLVFADQQGQHRLAAWTTGAPHAVTLDLRGTAPARLQTVSRDGVTGDLEVRQGRVRLLLTSSPGYLRLGGATVGAVE